MFEAVFALCLSGGDVCRDTLLPGYEADTEAQCAALLKENPPANAPHPFCTHGGPILPFEEIAPGVFAHRGAIAEPDAENLGDVSNIGFIVGNEAVAVIDSGGSRAVGEALWRAVRTETDLPVTHVILTHMHPDHVFGASVFKDAGARIVGHENLARALADRAENYTESFAALIGLGRFLGSTVVAPDMALGSTQEIDLGDRVLDLRAWPPAHTGTDLTVTDRESGILFAGDLLFDEHAPALDGSLLGWEAVLNGLAGETFTGVVPGHGGPLVDWPDGAVPLRHYLAVLEAETREAIDEGMRIGDAAETVAQDQAGAWALFDLYNPRNVTVAFTELEWE